MDFIKVFFSISLFFFAFSVVSAADTSFECDLCYFLVEELESRFLPGMTESQFVAEFESLCSEIPTFFEVACDAEVEHYAPIIYEGLQAHLEPEFICDSIHMCKEEVVNMVYSVDAPQGDDVTCEVCEIIVDAVEEAWLPTITYQELYNTIMNDTCRKLPHILEIACEAEVDEYLPEIYSMMQNAVAPSTICGLLTLCESTAAPVESSFECDLCEFLVTELEERFLPSMTEEEFIAEFDSLCDEIPTFFAIACKAEVDQYGPTVYQDLQNGLEPDTICDEIHMCAY
ncbi:Saposin like protein [Aduncisulcus paluster]|uniref:Saposin like protein n=1 Tax=Aduncisulcus paluster TaxID=2918883 RepID=A0ABQ5KTU8_9EUKA|nr:Saposin like protein [Aduncisulcus paluster]